MDELIYNQIGFSNDLINVVKQAEDYDEDYNKWQSHIC